MLHSKRLYSFSYVFPHFTPSSNTHESLVVNHTPHASVNRNAILACNSSGSLAGDCLNQVNDCAIYDR